MFLLKPQKLKRRRKASGQGITEYGAILAFVAVLVALTFGIANGQLSKSVSAAFSAVAVQLNNMSSAASSAS